MSRWGEPVMHRPCRPVAAFDEALAKLVADMVATMYAADGVGLAANQIGGDLRVFVFDCPDEDGIRQRGVVCNPVLTVPAGKDRTLDDGEEGCLSLPGAFITCPRADFASVTGVDHTGATVSYAGNGVFARCLQHETDHLDGVVFADRLPTRLRRKLYREAEAVAANYPPSWPANDGQRES